MFGLYYVPFIAYMLTILNLLTKNVETNIKNNKGREIRPHKRDLPLNKEWINGLYTFNKSSIKHLPALYNYIFVLLKQYFNMTSIWLQTKTTTEKKKQQLTSGKKMWISNPEMKHIYNKVSITIYIYNRTYDFYKKKLESFQFIWGPSLTIIKHRKISKLGKTIRDLEKNLERSLELNLWKTTKKVKQSLELNLKTAKKLKQNLGSTARILKRKFPIYLGKKKISYAVSNDYYITAIKWLKKSKYEALSQYKADILEVLKTDNKEKLVTILNYFKNNHYNFLVKQFTKELAYLKLKQRIVYNEFKYSEILLTPIIDILQTIFKKKVEFTIVTLKYPHLSSSILSQIISTKIRSPKFRGKALLPVYKGLNNVVAPALTKRKLEGVTIPFIGVQNIILANDTLVKGDNLDTFLTTNNTISKIWSSKNIDVLAVDNLENKGVAGVFVKITGRLTKRYKAQRALSKLRSKGTLKNVYSAYKNYSSSLSRGYSNINVEKIMIHSKLRIGAFGLTGWVSSH